MDKIILPRMEFLACHGVYEKEKQIPQTFCIGVEMGVDLKKAGETDDLTHTINYAPVYENIKQVVMHHCFDLIETVAERIAQNILAEGAISYVTVRVEKTHAQMADGNCIPACVEITRSKEER